MSEHLFSEGNDNALDNYEAMICTREQRQIHWSDRWQMGGDCFLRSLCAMYCRAVLSDELLHYLSQFIINYPILSIFRFLSAQSTALW